MLPYGLEQQLKKIRVMSKIFCIYTNQEIETADSNPEHIIPLSLGGCNTFVIPVSSAKNAELGTSVDGEMVNDPVMSLYRQALGYKGHSRKKVSPVFKKAFIKKSGKPVQLRYDIGKIGIFSPMDRRDLQDDELSGEIVRATIPFNKMIRIVFVAKVALATGFFIYGNVFVQHADHDSLRKLMNYKKADPLESLQELPLGVECNLSTSGDLDEKKLICELMGTSSVQFKLYPAINRIRATVGIGGKFLGSVTFDATVNHFPQAREHELEGGQIIKLIPEGLFKMSYNEMLDIINDSQKTLR